MKKTIFKRFVLLVFAVLLVLSIYPANVMEDVFSASAASNLPTWLDKATFDTTIYRGLYPDLAGKTDAELKEHWLSSGIKEGRTASCVFNVRYYLENNPDLKALYGTDYQKAYDQFVSSGYKEKRKSSLVFDGEYYCTNHPDVVSVFKDEYVRHYVETGMAEGRRASKTFCPSYYIFVRPDVAEAYPNDYTMQVKHYVVHGIKANVQAYDSTAPVISEVSVSNVSEEGYTIVCKVTDNYMVNKVSFPTWTDKNGQDDLAADFMNTQLGNKSGDNFIFRVNASDHNGEKGTYITHIYAVDREGNTSCYSDLTVKVESTDKFISLISTSWYKESNGIISNVKASTTVDSFIKHLKNGSVKIFDSNGTEINGKTHVGTGSAVKLYNNGVLVDQKVIVVTGDVDGNGIIDTTDCVRVKMAFLEKYTLNEYQAKGADLDGGGSVDLTDYMKIKHQILYGDNSADPDPKPEPEVDEQLDVKVPTLSDDLQTSYNFGTKLKVNDYSGIADVLTEAGLSYTASGYSSYSSNLFTVNSDFIANLGNAFSSQFNRMIFCYVSTAPLKCTVTYKIGSTTINDLFYLEAGTNTFCALIKDYLNGSKATALTSIKISTCEGVDGKFALCYVKTENYAVYSQDVYYIDSTIYRLGIRVSWGGGISYLHDKSYASEGIENLINQADTGRLVQQSYYGTHTNGEYTSGYYNNAKWPYNPVQGGDCNNNPSRLIDISVTSSSVYIKSQPMDWAHDGYLTPSYMENVYSLKDNFIRVDNRFVDFSGWEHRYLTQELPAFYTVSYLDNFTYYAGSNPWTNDALTSRNDLPFWGDPQYSDQSYFYLKKSNTETWCAWTNTNSGYGIGLYVPNIDILKAGRHSYDGSKLSTAGSTNYVAPLNCIKIVSYTPIEYSYMMTTGTLASIRNTFTVHKNFATNESLHQNYISKRIDD